MKELLGNCVTGLNDPTFQRLVASDATELAQLVENSSDLHQNKFLAQVPSMRGAIEAHPTRYTCGKSEDGRIYWVYDDETDIHAFYG